MWVQASSATSVKAADLRAAADGGALLKMNSIAPEKVSKTSASGIRGGGAHVGPHVAPRRQHPLERQQEQHVEDHRHHAGRSCSGTRSRLEDACWIAL